MSEKANISQNIIILLHQITYLNIMKRLELLNRLIKSLGQNLQQKQIYLQISLQNLFLKILFVLFQNLHFNMLEIIVISNENFPPITSFVASENTKTIFKLNQFLN